MTVLGFDDAVSNRRFLETWVFSFLFKLCFRVVRMFSSRHARKLFVGAWVRLSKAGCTFCFATPVDLVYVNYKAYFSDT